MDIGLEGNARLVHTGHQQVEGVSLVGSICCLLRAWSIAGNESVHFGDRDSILDETVDGSLESFWSTELCRSS